MKDDDVDDDDHNGVAVEPFIENTSLDSEILRVTAAGDPLSQPLYLYAGK